MTNENENFNREYTEFIISELEKLRILQSICSHDVRSMISKSIPILDLCIQQSQSSFDSFTNLFATTKEKLSNDLNNFDEKLMFIDPRPLFIWLLNDNNTIDSHIDHISKFVVKKLHSHLDLEKRIDHYRPDLLIIDKENLMKVDLKKLTSFMHLSQFSVRCSQNSKNAHIPIKIKHNLLKYIEDGLVDNTQKLQRFIDKFTEEQELQKKELEKIINKKQNEYGDMQNAEHFSH